MCISGVVLLTFEHLYQESSILVYNFYIFIHVYYIYILTWQILL